MRQIALSLLLTPALVVPCAAEAPSLADELRAEIARLRESLARAEQLLARVESEAAAPGPPAEPEPSAVAEARPAPARRAPALNTPPKLPPSKPERYEKKPPRFDVLLQGRYDHFDDSSQQTTFFLRKAELGVKGHITDNVDFSLELDPVRAPTRNDPYRRTYLRLTHIDRLHVKIGLEKAPIGLEELTSTAQIPFVDRSEVTDRFAAAEEVGIHFESNWDRFMMQLAVTNGGRRLLRDDNRHKDVSARVVFGLTPDLSLGVATLHGKTGPEELDRKRYNAELKLGDNFTGVQTEFYRAKDADNWSSAFYVSGFWARRLDAGWLTHIQPVARYEHIDSDDADPAKELRLLTLGFALHFDGNLAKLQFNYLNDLRSGGPRKDELRAQYQVEF